MSDMMKVVTSRKWVSVTALTDSLKTTFSSKCGLMLLKWGVMSWSTAALTNESADHCTDSGSKWCNQQWPFLTVFFFFLNTLYGLESDYSAPCMFCVVDLVKVLWWTVVHETLSQCFSTVFCLYDGRFLSYNGEI